jgi:hypothetical protein
MIALLLVACAAGDDSGDGSALGPATPVSEADAILVGEPRMDAGSTLAAGDVNSDGWDDLLVGAPNTSAGGDEANYAGRVHVVLGPVAGDVDLGTSETLIGDGLWIGLDGLAAGDIAGLGSDQVIVGNPWHHSDAPMGQVMVFPNWNGDLAFEAANAVVTVVGDVAEAEGSAILASRDLDGDGASDLVTGIHDWDGGPGMVAVHRGPVAGHRATSDADVLLTSVASADQAGRSIAYGEDLNGDGWEDLLVGAANRDGRGAVYVAYGPLSGDATLDADTILGTVDDANFGAGIVGIADQDGDGNAEIAVGAPAEKDAGGVHDGAVYVTHGPVEGTVTLEDPILTGEPGAGFLGYALSWGARGCGASSLYAGGVGDYYMDHDAAGNVYAFDGASDDIAAIWHGENGSDRAGDAVLTGADLDGDGCSDLAIGASWNDRNGTNSGAVYLFSEG